MSRSCLLSMCVDIGGCGEMKGKSGRLFSGKRWQEQAAGKLNIERNVCHQIFFSSRPLLPFFSGYFSFNVYGNESETISGSWSDYDSGWETTVHLCFSRNISTDSESSTLTTEVGCARKNSRISTKNFHLKTLKAFNFVQQLEHFAIEVMIYFKMLATLRNGRKVTRN